jgi:hypothetical protein
MLGIKSHGYVALFATDEWQKFGWRPGLFRIKTGGAGWNAKGAAWWCRPGEKYSFVDLEGALTLLRDMARAALRLPVELRGDWPPDIKRGDRIRVTRRGPGLPVVKGEQEGAQDPRGECPDQHTVIAFATSSPFRDSANQWAIMALRLGIVMCRDCEVVR